ncbi:DUF835 domain-containing protein [Candidatus Woesearchaeota archaeon]|nr:DUF835 domain-containing protein [Candidatus Woesearchaeota archaeon]
MKLERGLMAGLFLALLLVGLVILVSYLSFQKIEQFNQEQLMENQLVKTKYAATQIEAHLTGLQKLLEQGEDCDTNGILKADALGTIVCASPELADYVGLNIKDKEYFQTATENEVSIVAVTKQGSNPQIIVTVPLAKYGQFSGVRMAIVELQQLHWLYLQSIVSNPPKSMYAIFDGNDVIYASEKIPVVSSSEPASMQHLDPLGETMVTSSDLIFGHEHWRLAVLTPLRNVTGELEKLRRQLLGALMVIVGTLLSASIAGASLYRSRQKLKQKLDTLTLEKLGAGELEGNKYTDADIDLEPGKMYLIKDGEEKARALFLSALNKNYAGLGAVRDDPRTLRKKYNVQKTPLVWITPNKVAGVACESNIEPLFELMKEFLRQNDGVVLLEGIEYLSLQHPSPLLLAHLQQLKDAATARQSIVLLAVKPEVCPAPVLAAVQAMASDVYGESVLTAQEKEILRTINEKNSMSTLVSFTDITKQLEITKPTTRAKISRLHGLGLVEVQTVGRFKALKITSKGRKLI